MFGVDPWIPFGLLLVGGYVYWLYTDLLRPWLAGEPALAWEEGEDG